MSSSWWYGVALFPIVALTALLARVGSRRFIVASSSSTDPNIATALVSFALTVASFWGGILVALLVLASLLMDIRALGDDESWSPSVTWSLAGIAHLGGAVFAPLLALSMPALSYYLYRRHERLGSP